MMSRQLPFGGSSLVATSSFKLKVQRAFHSLATLKYSASNKSISHSNSCLYQIHFQQNLYREKNAPLFPVFLPVNCCSFPAVALPSFCPMYTCNLYTCSSQIFVGAFCNIDRNDLITQNSSPILISNKLKRILTKIQNLKSGIPIFYGLPPNCCSVLSPYLDL